MLLPEEIEHAVDTLAGEPVEPDYQSYYPVLTAYANNAAKHGQAINGSGVHWVLIDYDFSTKHLHVFEPLSIMALCAGLTKGGTRLGFQIVPHATGVIH